MMKTTMTMMCALVVCMVQAVQQSVTVPSVGAVTLNAAKPGGWTFDVQASEDDGRDVVTVRISSPTNAMPPRFGVFFRVPGAGVQNVWTSDCGKDGFHLWPQLWWGGQSRYHSELAYDTPIAVGFNSDEKSPVANNCRMSYQQPSPRESARKDPRTSHSFQDQSANRP